MTTQPKEPLLRMAKRDSISPRAAWGIRAAAFLLALITGGLLLLLLGHNPITVYSAMISGAWGSPTVARETSEDRSSAAHHLPWHFAGVPHEVLEHRR